MHKLIESKSIILDKFSKIYSDSIVFNDSKSKFLLTNTNIQNIFKIFNKFLFDNKLKPIDIKILSYNNIIKFLKTFDNTKLIPQNSFIGLYNIVILNNESDITLDTKLSITDKSILLNRDKLIGTSFAFLIASVCHELIHYYDELYGEYQDLIKHEIIDKIDINAHTTPTFILKLQEAQNMNIDVISDISLSNTTIKTLDYQAYLKALSAQVNEDDIQKTKKLSKYHLFHIQPKDNKIFVHTF